jgi:hypothetical protein
MKSEKEILQDKLNAIEKKEAEDIIRLHYPEFKKFEGRYFRTKNSYGGGCKDWFYYTKILTIKPEYIYYIKSQGITSYFDGYSFEVTSDGTISIRNIKMGYLHHLVTEIPEKEFNESWNKMIEKLNKLQ